MRRINLLLAHSRRPRHPLPHQRRPLPRHQPIITKSNRARLNPVHRRPIMNLTSRIHIQMPHLPPRIPLNNNNIRPRLANMRRPIMINRQHRTKLQHRLRHQNDRTTKRQTRPNTHTHIVTRHLRNFTRHNRPLHPSIMHNQTKALSHR